MSKRKGINELSIMKKDMIKHLKKDMKDEMTRYKDDKDEIRRMVRGGTLITNYKGPGNTKRNVNYINDDKLITFEDIIDNVKTLYSPNYIYLQNQYKTGNLNPDENIAFDEATTYLKLKSPETKSQFLINYKKKQEMNKKEYNERKKLQSELQEDREQVVESKDYNSLVEQLTLKGLKTNKIFEHELVTKKIQKILKPFVKENFILTSEDGNIKGLISTNIIQEKYLSFDFISDNYFIDAKYYNNTKTGADYIMNKSLKGVEAIKWAYDKDYKEEKDIYDGEMLKYKKYTDNEKKEIDDKYQHGFDYYFHNISENYEHFIPLTVAKIIPAKKSSETLVKWKDNKVCMIDKQNKELTSYKNDIKIIYSYADGLYILETVVNNPYFDKTTNTFKLGKYESMGDGGYRSFDYKIPPKFLIKIK